MTIMRCPIHQKREVKLAHILIVEDDLEIADAVADLLLSAGHLVRVAGNGLEGLRKVTEEPPDLILLDVQMPVLDGPGMASALAAQREGQPPIPIVLISAGGDVRKVADRIGTAHFLRKPFSFDQIIGLVNLALASGRS
jgi:CheY-like chemotaxis protein